MNEKEVLDKAKEWNVKFVRLQFTDIFGTLKNVSVPVEQLEKALDGEMMFDGSSIEGFVRIEESDMYLKPDPTTFTLFPWKSKESAVARLICNVYNSDDEPFIGCPRCILQKVLAEAKEMGYSMVAGPEAEFFLFHLDEKGEPTTITQDKGGYFDLSPVDLGESARREMVIMLQDMGFEIEASHHEVAEGQHEIDFKYDDALDIADNIMTFRLVVRTVAHRHGLHATFMPKPIFGINGSGMHTHQSLFKNGENAFFDPSQPHEMSKVAINYLGGLIHHARGYTAITNPLINSYKRLVPGFEAPVYIAWSEKNRSPLIRVPARRGIGTRLELRSPDPSCNPYLALAVMLKAGLNGIKEEMIPPDPVDLNIYDMSPEELDNYKIGILPQNLYEALQEMSKDEVIKDAIGPHVYNRFTTAKKLQWEKYQTAVHPWELDAYLKRY